MGTIKQRLQLADCRHAVYLYLYQELDTARYFKAKVPRSGSSVPRTLSLSTTSTTQVPGRSSESPENVITGTDKYMLYRLPPIFPAKQLISFWSKVAWPVGERILYSHLTFAFPDGSSFGLEKKVKMKTFLP